MDDDYWANLKYDDYKNTKHIIECRDEQYLLAIKAMLESLENKDSRKRF